MAKNTTEVVAFLLSLGQAAALSRDDGVIDLSDAAYFFDALRKLYPALQDATAVLDELKAWQESDTDEITKLAEEFDIPQDDVEAIVRDALKIAGPIIEFLAKFRAE